MYHGRVKINGERLPVSLPQQKVGGRIEPSISLINDSWGQKKCKVYMEEGGRVTGGKEPHPRNLRMGKLNTCPSIQIQYELCEMVARSQANSSPNGCRLR